jgi:hypothetical protein
VYYDTEVNMITKTVEIFLSMKPKRSTYLDARPMSSVYALLKEHLADLLLRWWRKAQKGHIILQGGIRWYAWKRKAPLAAIPISWRDFQLTTFASQHCSNSEIEPFAPIYAFCKLAPEFRTCVPNKQSMLCHSKALPDVTTCVR